MKKFIAFVFALMLYISAFGSDSLTVFYRIRVDQDIDLSSQRLVTLGLEKAREAKADYVMIDLDTYGGALNAADSIRSAILRYEKPVIAYVNMQAASAGDSAQMVQMVKRVMESPDGAALVERINRAMQKR